MDYESKLELVGKDVYMLKHVENQTPEICLEAVKQTSNAIICVKDKSMLKDILKPEPNKSAVMSAF